MVVRWNSVGQCHECVRVYMGILNIKLVIISIGPLELPRYLEAG